MTLAITCPSCGNEAVPAGDNWGAWKCPNRACNRYARVFIPRVMQTPFVRKKKWYAKTRRASDSSHKT